MAITWFDAHLDLAYLAVAGRDLTKPLDVTAPPHPPAGVTLESLREGDVRFALATIFTEPVEASANAGAASGGFAEPQMYHAGDVARAHAAGRAQLEVYLTWRDLGLISFGLADGLMVDPGVGEIRGGMGVAELRTPTLASLIDRHTRREQLRVGILMENADPIRTPDELAWWQSRGVLAVGLAWARASRYAGGNSTDLGLTDLGRALVREMDRLGVVHDVSHLSDRSLRELLDMTDKPVVASHSNCRALLCPELVSTSDSAAVLSSQRHLMDETIREIGRRGGVVGLNLFSKFLIPMGAGHSPKQPGVVGTGARAAIAACVEHIEHICDVMGHRRGIGLGSDMDGGFSAALLPETINRPADLERLSDSLAARGWSDEDVRAFACENWVRFFVEQLPRPVKT